ncbi:hypothetical protein HK105_204742 [Polyrhizophydium stewartii]|uniref:Ankyrin repeat protein n=1 Tax=Polyrhizophydium stewartii TaxID=2732419 RepID=A0ABR4N8H2_9FUNG
MQNKILKHAGPLTLWVNGRIDDDNINLKQFKALLLEVFETDWQGDLTALPSNKFFFSNLDALLRRIRTRSMHARIKALKAINFNGGLDQAAIINGWTDLLDFEEPGRIGFSAARCGGIAVLENLVDERKVVVLEVEHAELAAAFGHLELLKWLAARMPDGSWSTTVMDWAAGNAHLDCVKWLSANRTEGCSTDAMDDAAGNGHLDSVKWLHDNRTEGCTTDAMDGAAKKGHLAVVKFLHANRTEGCTTYAMILAALNGHADVVEFLHLNLTQSNLADAAKIAAEYNKPAMIQRIHALAPDMINVDLANEAAAEGSISALDWIFGNTSVRPTEGSISQAIKNGCFRTLQWFRTRMPEVFRSHAMSKIGKESADTAIEWLGRDNIPVHHTDVLQLAIEERQIPAIKWVLQHLRNTRWHDGDLERAHELVGAA